MAEQPPQRTAQPAQSPPAAPAKTKPTAKPRARKATDANYLPVTEAELDSVIAYSATREKEEEAMARFEKYRSAENIPNQPYEPQDDRWLMRLRRYLKFFKDRTTSSSGTKTASGWPITREKFLLWAHRDPRPTMRSITTYLQTIEAARVATHYIFAADFPDLSKKSLQLDPLVRDTLSEVERKLAETVAVRPDSTTTAQTEPKTAQASSSAATAYRLAAQPPDVAQDTPQGSPNAPKTQTSTSTPKASISTANTSSSTVKPCSPTVTVSIPAVKPRGTPQASTDTPQGPPEAAKNQTNTSNPKASVSTANTISSTSRTSSSTAKTSSYTSKISASIPKISSSTVRPSSSTVKTGASAAKSYDTAPAIQGPPTAPKNQANPSTVETSIRPAKPPTATTPQAATNTLQPPPAASTHKTNISTDKAVTPAAKISSAVAQGSVSAPQDSTSTAKPPITSTSHATTETARVPAKPSKKFPTLNTATTMATTHETATMTTTHETATTTIPQITQTTAAPAHPETSHQSSAVPADAAASAPLPHKIQFTLPPKKQLQPSSSASLTSPRLSRIESSGAPGKSNPQASERTRPSYPVSSKGTVISKAESSQSSARRTANPPKSAKQKSLETAKPPTPAKKTRRMSGSSSDSPLALLPTRSQRRKIAKADHHRESLPHPAHQNPSPVDHPPRESLPPAQENPRPINHPVVDCVDEKDQKFIHDVDEQDQKFIQPPIYEHVDVFTDIRVPEVRKQFFDALRRDHRNNLSTEEVLEGLSAEMEALTGPGGELGHVGSQEDLAACLKTYLDFWAAEGISGFPIQALKVCVWVDSYDPAVTEKEALDISVSFDRLCRLIAAGFADVEQGTMFDYPYSLLDTPLWQSFFDHHGWPLHHHDPTPPPLNDTRHMHLPPPKSMSPSSTIGSSLTSLNSHPHSPSPFLDRYPDSGISASFLPDSQTGLHSDPKKARGGHHLEALDHQPELTEENYQQFCYKREAIGSVEHHNFLRNLRSFVRLLSA